MSGSARPIRALPDQLINRIAAGEVIERPASVLKELVENSLDAGATRIDIDARGGGIEWLSVRDDGHGVAGPEMPLALSRHCTSKIDSTHDLVSIESLGFRGEALASIVAVADVTLCSRTAGDTHGWRISATAGGLPVAAEPDAWPRGTKVEVAGLFRNTPARRRFLKRPQTEYQHIYQLLRRLGFCRPDVAFRLHHDGRRGLELPRADTASAAARRWRQLFGAVFANAASVVEVDAEEVSIRGWVGAPELSRSQSDLQYLAVNGRTIRDRQLAHAVRLAFDDRIQAGRHPAYALHIRLPASEVDVNVHPGKSEVRFARLREVHDLLYTAVHRALGGAGTEPLAYDTTPAATGPRSIRDETRPSAPCGDSMPRHAPRAAPAPGALGEVVAVVEARYALTRDGDRLAVVDLRHLIGAVVQARLEQALTCGAVASRPLLIPETLATAGTRLADQTRQQLAAWGIEIDALGPETLVLRTVPVLFPEIDVARFVRGLVSRGDGGRALAPAVIAGLVAECAAIPAVEKHCSRLLDAMAQLLREAGIPLHDHVAYMDGAALQGFIDAHVRGR